MVTTELQIGDKVRVRPLGANGVIVRVSARLKHAPYLVEVPGHETRAYAVDDLQKLAASIPLAPVQAVRGSSGARVCGVIGCWRTIDPAQPTCAKCGTPWVLP